MLLIRRRSTWVLALLGVAAALALWVVGGRTAQVSAGTAPRASASTGAPASGPAFTPAWPEGARRLYALRFESELRPLETQESVPLGWKGELAITVLEASVSRIRLAFEFTGSTTGEQSPDARRELEVGLKLPFFAVLEKTGRVLECGSSPGASVAVENAWKSLLSQLQFVGGSGSAWTSEEDDPTGKYKAEYHLEKPQFGFSKRKRAYSSLHPRPGTATSKTRYELERSEVEFEFDAARALRRAQGREHVIARSAPPIPSFAAKTAFDLELRESATNAEPQLTRLRLLAQAALRSTLASGPASRMRRDELDRGALANVSMPEVWRVIDEARQQDEEGRARRTRAKALLAAHLRQHPADAERVKMRALGRRDDKKELLNVLGEAGTPESQDVLHELSQSRSLTDADHKSAALALSNVDHPTEKTVERLKALTSDTKLGKQGLYGLGAAARALLASNPAVSDGAVQFLLDRLAKAQISRDIEVLLAALGGSGHPLALPAIEQHVEHSVPEVRRAAIWALRLIQSVRVDRLLARILERPDASDRAAAVKTMAFRPATAESTARLAQVLKNDPAPLVRSAVVRECQELLRVNSEMKAAFQSCAEKDGDPAVREAAKRALSALEQRG